MIYLFWLTTSLPAFDIGPACGVPIYYHDKGSGRQARTTPPVHGCTYREVPIVKVSFSLLEIVLGLVRKQPGLFLLGIDTGTI